MLTAENPLLARAQSAVDHLAAPGGAAPPAGAAPAVVLRYVRALQQAERDLAAAAAARNAGRTDVAATPGPQRAGVDAAIARQVTLAARRLDRDRAGALAILNGIFQLGQVPDPPVDGECRGQLVTPALAAPVDRLGRFLAGLYMPWQGKRFFAAAGGGDNLFAASVRYSGRIYWPAFAAYFPLRPGVVTAFPFQTYTGPGVADPTLGTLKLDYDLTANPRFLVRSVLDELVQITSNYYLGKVHLRLPGGGYRLAAFFALRRVR